MRSGSSIEAALGRLDNDKVRKTGSVVETIDDLHGAFQRVRNWYRGRMQWTVTVQSGDRLYDAALRWFLSEEADTAPPRSVKAAISSRRRFMDDDYSTGRTPVGPTLSVFYDERGRRQITIEGHRITVFINRAQPTAGPQDGSFRSVQPDTLSFQAWSYAGQQAVLDLLERIAGDQQKAKPALHLMSNWGDWMRRDDLPERTLDSVVLATGQIERLRDDLQDFIEQEDEYVRRGMPYHRGYLLYGPPGTGKTSLVRALAAHFGLDLWYAPLGDLQKDTSLLTLINQVRPGSILLLEDVDAFQATHNRDEDKESNNSGLSIAGLLNALDGVATPHGLITFLTTNDRNVIDPALLRPGRVDLQEEIGMPDADQVRRLLNEWYACNLDTGANDLFAGYTGSTADVTEILKRNLNDIDGAMSELRQVEKVAEERSVTVAELEEKRNERRAGRTGSTGGKRS